MKEQELQTAQGHLVPKEWDIESYVLTPKVKREQSTPSEDVEPTSIDDIEFLTVEEAEAKSKAEFFAKKGWTDGHGSTVAGTKYVLIDGYQRVYGSHQSNINDFIVIDDGETIFTAETWSYSKSRQEFIFA